MYTDADLKVAIENVIFTDSSADAFRSSISEIGNSPSADEENFKLIGATNKGQSFINRLAEHKRVRSCLLSKKKDLTQSTQMWVVLRYEIP